MRTTPAPNPRVDKHPSPTLTTPLAPPKPSLVSAPSPHIRSKQARSRTRFPVSEPKPAPPSPRSTTGAVSSRFCDRSRASRAICSATLPRWCVGAGVLSGSWAATALPRCLSRRLQELQRGLPLLASPIRAIDHASGHQPLPQQVPGALRPNPVGFTRSPRGLTDGGEPGRFPTIADQAIAHAAGVRRSRALLDDRPARLAATSRCALRS